MPLWAQTRTQAFRVMFYNVENLFDPYDDPNTRDDEFLPTGMRRWGFKRYYHHLQQTARVILAAGEWQTPALVGLCEVESDSVLIHLTQRTLLRKQHYAYCLTKGSDARGIQCALLYQPSQFKQVGQASHRIPFTQAGRRSRDLLHVWGKVITGDTLDVFVCHFPSRSGGQRETEPARLDAARYLRHLCDSLFGVRQTANFLLMGDFNDAPTDRSLRVIEASSQPNQQITNLFAAPQTIPFEGSHKHQGTWAQLDQLLISQQWLLHLKKGSPSVFAPAFLLTEDKAHNGMRPKRNYHGMQYEGGYSDHLPVVADFLLPFATH